MLFSNNPKKKVQKLIKKIEKGSAADSDLILIKEVVNKEPTILPDIVEALSAILNKDNPKAFKPALRVLNMLADVDIGTISKFFDMIVSCLMRKLKNDELLIVLEIMYKVFQYYPDYMGRAISDLISCFQNIDSTVREKTYFLLALIADKHPEFYRNRSRELTGVLNGLNVDARIYTCRLIGKIAEKDPTLVKDTHDDLEYMYINHSSHELRLEAARAIRKLKIDDKVIMYIPHTNGKFKKLDTDKMANSGESTGHKPPSGEPKINYVADDKEMQALDSLKSEFIELLKPKGEDVRNMLTALGLEHMIKENVEGKSKSAESSMPVKGTGLRIEGEDKRMLELALEKTISSRTITSAMILDSGGNIVALSGPPIDKTLIGNLREMFSFEINDKFRSRISLERADNKIIAVRLGIKAILVVMTDAKIPIGAVILELNKSIEKIDELGLGEIEEKKE